MAAAWEDFEEPFGFLIDLELEVSSPEHNAGGGVNVPRPHPPLLLLKSMLKEW